MAMNEDSVVSSLNELRQMANDRARRETEARARVDERSSWDQSRGHTGRRSEVRPRITEIHGTGQRLSVDSPRTLMGGHGTQDQPAQQPYGAPQGGYGYGYSHAVQPEAYPQAPVAQKSAVGPVLLTIILLGGAAGGGYWKLQQDWSATLRARDAAILQAEEGRNRAVEAASRAQQEAKVLIAAAEEKVKAAEKTAVPAAPAAAPAPAAPKVAAVAAKPSKSERSSRRGRRASAAKKATARVERPAPPPPALLDEAKPPGMPKIAGKKKISDDPLAGLKL